ncbi:McrB family protein [Formosa sp. 3Alg 14/1]|uniref:McrB family protein n=1 Tax=Formosa sp. 3Alg 14/1 TaxID=3382190 RepID=UPI0039BDF07B
MENILVNNIIEKAKRLNKLKVNEASLFEYVNKNHDNLEEVIEQYTPVSEFRPVKTLRFLIANELRQGKTISKTEIDDLKQAIENRDISAYYHFNETLQQSLTNYKNSKSGMFPNWKDAFKILFPFVYSISDNFQIKEQLEVMANEIVEVNNLQNIQKHKVSFQGSNNYGSDSVWVAIIPESSPSVQYAYQLFFSITKNGIVGGVHKGHNLTKQEFLNQDEKFTSWTDFIKHTQQNKTLWEESNEGVNFIFINDENIFKKVLKNINTLALGQYYAVIDKFKSDLELQDQENLVFSTAQKRLSFQVGKRYCLNVKKEVFDFISNEVIEEDQGKKEIFTSNTGSDYLYKERKIDMVLSNYDDIKRAVENEIERDKHTDAKEYDNSAFRKSVFDKEYRLKIFTQLGISYAENIDMQNIMKDHISNKISVEPRETYKAPLNQIFYGPPGTGKTYNTIIEAAKIIKEEASINYNAALQVFNDNLGDKIEFITFHQNYSYEDFIQGLRPDVEIGGELSFFKSDGIFKKIADRALKNAKDSKNPDSAKKEFLEVFMELIKPLQEGETNEVEVKMKQTSFYITEVGEKSIEFRKNQGESKHSLSIATLKKMYDAGENKIILGGLQPYYNPILNELLQQGKRNVEQVLKQNYVIIIDEINRANISRVFGELITLIEKDKRSEGKTPLMATLPSGDKFIVPSNLYIIGTMNTADKSIALLDIALRRRFEFVPMYPNSQSTSDKIVYDATILDAINKEVISRKGYDFTIGHSYFMGEDYNLENTINNKVVPLLLEYFMNDIEEVQKILQLAKIIVDGWPMRYVSND